MSHRTRTYTLDANGKSEMIIVEGVGNAVKIQHTKTRGRRTSILLKWFYGFIGLVCSCTLFIKASRYGDISSMIALCLLLVSFVIGYKLLIATGKPKISLQMQSECVLLFPKLGLQITDINGQSRFVQASDIDFFCINEGFEHCRVVVYLLLVLQDKRCIILFNETRPSTDGLSMAFDALDTWLIDAKTSPSTHPMNIRLQDGK